MKTHPNKTYVTNTESVPIYLQIRCMVWFGPESEVITNNIGPAIRCS